MKVVIINNSDTRGGAAVVSARLLRALRALGVDARMLVTHKGSDDPDIALAGSALGRKLSFLEECLDVFLHNGLSRKRLFTISTGSAGLDLASHPWVRQADAVLVNWANQGMLSLKETARIKAPVIWTMHDMWCFTGVCHYPGKCARYQGQCGECPMLGWMSLPGDLSYRVWREKARLYDAKSMRFVAVSRWLAQAAKSSTLLADADIKVIPNAFPVEDFRIGPSTTRAELGLPPSDKLVVMGAARLDVGIKRLDLAIEALNKLAGEDVAAVFYGGIRDASAFDSLKIPYAYLGTVPPSRLSEIYAHADIVLSAADYETWGATLAEGMASGCAAVAFGGDGRQDIVDHLRTGYLAKPGNADDLAAGLRWALSANLDPQAQRAAIESRFSSTSVARQYLSLIHSVTQGQIPQRPTEKNK